MKTFLRLFLCVGVQILWLAGCSTTATPTQDQMYEADRGMLQADLGAVPMELDLGPEPDQEFIPSAHPIPTRVTTIISMDQIAAGERLQVRCETYDQNGLAILEAPTQIDVRPAAGIEFESTDMGWQLTGTKAGAYSVFCTYPSAGLRDPQGRAISVIPAQASWIQTKLDPEVVTAGQSTEIRCEITDDYGNEIDDSDAIAIMLTPTGMEQRLEGRTLTTTRSGEVQVNCTAGAARATPATLVVRPDRPATLNAAVTPEKMTYRIGEVVSVNVFVGDQYGNEIINPSINYYTEPMLASFGPRRFRLTTEGFFQITATLPDSEPELSETIEIIVDDRGPVIDCLSPSFGAVVRASNGSNIDFEGTVDDLSGVSEVLVNGQVVPFDGGATFATSISTTPGLNIVDLEARDNLGKSSRALCGFFVAPNFLSPTSVASNSIALDLRQNAVDDGDNGPIVQSFGDLIRLITGSDGLQTTIDQTLAASPRLVANQSFGIGTLRYLDYRGGLSITEPDLAMSLDPNGLGFDMSVQEVRMNVRASGCSLCSCSVFGASCAISCTTDGTITIRGTDALSIFKPLLSGGTIAVDSLGTLVTVEDIDTNFSGLCGNLVDAALAVAGAFSSFLEDTVADALTELIDGTLAGALADALNNIDFSAFAFNFELDGFNGQPANLALNTSLTRVSVNGTRLQLGLGTKVTGPARNAVDVLGIPKFGSGVLSGYPSQGSMSALIDAALINQVMFGLWRANFFTIDDVGGLNPNDTGALQASIRLLAPPAIEILNDGRSFKLHFGPAAGSLTYADLLSSPIELRFGAVLVADIALSDGDEVIFAPNGLEFETIRLDVAGSPLDAELAAALEAEIADIVVELLNEAVTGALPTLPIPEFALPTDLPGFSLPPNLSLGIRNPSLNLRPQSLIINGGFGQ